MRDRLRVSVVLCTRNGAPYLEPMLDSLEAQRRPPDEVVVRDDRSSDATLALLERFEARTGYPVRVARNTDRQGPTRNFGRALADARGEVLMLADQDDRWRPDKIETLAGRLEERPELGYVFSDAELLEADGRRAGTRFWEEAGLGRDLPERFNRGGAEQLRCLLRRNVTPGAAMALRSGLRAWTHPLPEDWPHDWWLAAVATAGGRFGEALEAALLEYREHPGQARGLERPSSAPWARYRRHRARMASAASRHERHWARLETLRARLERRLGAAGDWPDDLRACLREAIDTERRHVAHVRARERIRRGPFGEALVGFLREVGSGRYRRYSGSWLSAAADLWERGVGDGRA